MYKNPSIKPLTEGFLGESGKDSTIQKNLVGLMSNFYSKYICFKAYRGRERIFAGFKEYYAKKSQQSASDMVKARHDVLQRYDLCDKDIAHFDLRS